jgi:hypothetical protein
MAENTVKRVKIAMEPFIRAWETSNSAKEVSEKLGIKLTSVLARATKYRTNNIPLKKMPRKTGIKLDVEAAQALLAELRQ